MSLNNTQFSMDDYMREQQNFFESALHQSFPAIHSDPEKLFQSMHYSLMSKGKRVRPILCFATAECLGLSKDSVLPLAIALECIHVFSLIHDDLPCMDDDDFRRGQPTNHKVFGEACAILSGDALLAEAFVQLTRLDKTKFNPNAIIHVIAEVARATGAEGMIAGQVIDIESEGQLISAERLKTLHTLKTGALIRASVLTPALLAESSLEIQNTLTKYAYAIGLSFQIADDILDVEGVDIGKDLHSDENKNKSTYPKIWGMDESKITLQNLLQEALNALKDFGDKAIPLRALAHYIVERKK